MLNRRQINVQRSNLASMLRISVKSLLDHACLYNSVDNDCEQFINFCAVFEQVVSHRLRPYPRKMWLPRGNGSPRNFWDVLLDQQSVTPSFMYRTCIPNIEAIETLKSPKAKFRAFLRVALMEKKLSDYMTWILNNTRLVRESYMEGALFASEDASMLVGDLIGLNAIDFNFCLKEEESELLGPLEISYGPFLKYKQSTASRTSDEVEMMQLSKNETDEDIPIPEEILEEYGRMQLLVRDRRAIKEQKDYLEELVRLREGQMVELTQKCERMYQEHLHREQDWEMQRSTLDSCVLELQAQMSALRKQNESLRSQVVSLKQFKERVEMKEVPMIEMAGGGDKEGQDYEQSGDSDRSTSSQYRYAKRQRVSSTPSDQRSIMSLASDRAQGDSQSMVPLTGSLADVSVPVIDAPSKTTEAHQMQVVISEESPRKEDTGCVNTDTLEKETTDQDCGTDKTASDDSSQTNHINKTENQETEPSGERTGAEKMSESYLIAGDSTVSLEEDQRPNLSPEGQAGAGDGSSEVKASTENSSSQLMVHDSGHVMTTSDGAVSTASSEPATSDPEVLDRSNISSDSGSDAAWDMLSDSEHGEQKEEELREN